MKVICHGCEQPFEKSAQRMWKWRKRGNSHHFCSRSCRSLAAKRSRTVRCSVCHSEFTKIGMPASATKNFYCSKCRGKVDVNCSICGTVVKKWKSAIRFTNQTTFYCSHDCKRKGQRIGWNSVTRSALKLKWTREFGEAALVCTRCGYDKSYNIHLHHKIYVVNGGSNDPNNLEPVCKNCHGEEHYAHGKDTD